MASKSKSSKNKKRPKVPSAQMIDTGNLKQPQMTPYLTAENLEGIWRNAMEEQQRWFPTQLQNQLTAQSELYRQMGALQREQAPQFAKTAYDMMSRYMPNFQGTYEQLGSALRNQLAAGAPAEFTKGYQALGENLRNQLAQGVPAEFMKAYEGLGKRVSEGLQQGYELGPDLAGEIEQGIRASQAARGNYLGPAVTAEEAFGKGQNAVNLYNQRLQAAQGYLSGQNPTDVAGRITGQMQNYLQGRNPFDINLQAQGALQNYLQGNNPANVMGQLAGSFMGQQYYPTSTYLDTNLGTQIGGTAQQGISNYNQTLNSALQDYNRNYITSFDTNNKYQYENYDRNFEGYLYDQAVKHGLYSRPGALGGGGMGGGIMGGLGMGAGVLGAGAAGVAASGAIGTGATAGIVSGIGAALAAL